MKVIEINQKPHKCPMCDVRFTNRRNIPCHIENYHPKSTLKHQCILCKKLYQTKGNYDQHFDKTHLFGYLLYTSPESVDVKGNRIHNTLQLDFNDLISMNLFCIVREVNGPKLSIKRKLNVSSKQKSSNVEESKHRVIAHHSYDNPFGKKQFFTSESTTTDKAFVERRQMVYAYDLLPLD